MIKSKTPARGSFDYLLKDLNDVKPVVWNNPPPPPERGGGPGRVRIEIEINQTRQALPSHSGRHLIGWLILIGIFMALVSAHSEQRWDQNEWHGSSFHFKDSNTTYSDFYGPNGQTRRCTSFKFKDSTTVYVDCR